MRPRPVARHLEIGVPTRRFILLALAGYAAPALADIGAVTVESLKDNGYAIVGEATVTGYIDSDGVKHDDFQGCNFGWRIILDFVSELTCEEYNYAYAFMPKAVVLVRGKSLRMVVGNHVYDVIH